MQLVIDVDDNLYTRLFDNGVQDNEIPVDDICEMAKAIRKGIPLPKEHKTKQLIDELSKMSPMVITTAYIHAINYTLYGVDVTEKWITATQNASALEKAYKRGYYDALQRQEES